MNIFLCSDLHIGHKGMTTFTRDDGTPQRPWATVEEHDEALIANWNSVVRPKDKVYNLGDVVINRKAFPTLVRLNGTKVLIKGNHDLFRIEEYLPYFKDVRACHPLDGFMMSHIPIHPASLSRWTGNIHGHLHHNEVSTETHYKVASFGKQDTVIENTLDTRYMCVSMEHIDYTPISWDEAKKKFEERKHGE